MEPIYVTPVLKKTDIGYEKNFYIDTDKEDDDWTRIQICASGLDNYVDLDGVEKISFEVYTKKAADCVKIKMISKDSGVFEVDNEELGMIPTSTANTIKDLCEEYNTETLYVKCCEE